MKKLIMLAVLLLLTIPVLAYECEEGDPICACPVQEFQDTDSYADRDKFGYGVIGDIVLLETDWWFMEELGLWVPWDWNTHEYGVYAKVKVSLPKLFKGE